MNMDKNQAQKIIRDTFENSFDKSSFTGFIKNLLNRVDNAPFTYQGNYIPDAYKQYIKTLERIGKFSDGENNIDILVITLQKETSLERARTMQRNFVAWYLNGSRGGKMKDAAIVAYVSPDGTDWRFSLVKMDYKFEQTTTGKMKVKEEFTPARRWSFLVGANEKSHTAQSRLINILVNDEHTPTLEEIEKAFDIETVTKEFFLKYRELFLRTKEELDKVVKNDPKIKADFESKGVDTVNFAKKLLGQIVFLYFLQKKGWFGVSRDDDWGTGSKHFLRELFKKKHADYNNFYNDILEPLFYEALRIDRSHDDGYYSRFNCKIPFLNGGLFDPIGNYNWVHTDIIIPDRLFSNNEKTKEGDTGTGILDVFDRYNFTVKEDEPLEKEVAIDPELLGKAYEKFNAIRPDNFDEFKETLKSGNTGEENKFNKKFGVYYTPREIVHYMCQQSLINYLDTAVNIYKESIITKPAVQKKLFGPQDPMQLTISSDSYKPIIPKKDIETLIHIGEQVSENEARILSKGKETKTYSHQLPESIRKNAKPIDDKLAEITVCDPAVGSGAFPVGMMSEIVRARNVLSTYIKDDSRTPYEFKRCCIEHSLYGVDIDPGAVEIAKLRMWLSLVVDEDDIKNIKPLPNLDYRIMQGNSLISEFMGINFDDDKVNKSGGLFKYETDELIEEFQKKKDEFLNASNVSKKSELKEEVEGLLIKIFVTKLKTQKADYFNRLKDIENKYSIMTNENQRNELIKQDKEKLYKESGFDLESLEKQLKEFTSGRKTKPFFLWNLYFSEVFHKKGGFDVVIANPPYVQIKQISWADRKVYENIFKSAVGRFNLFYFFIDLSGNLLRPSGVSAFIVPDRLLLNIQCSELRKWLLEQQKILEIDSFAEGVFEAIVDSIIIIYQNVGSDSVDVKVKNRILLSSLKQNLAINIPVSYFLNSPNNQFDLSYNPSTARLLGKIKAQSIILGEISEIKDGIIQGKVADKLFLNNPLDSDSKPLLFGENITRYSIQFNNKWVNYKPSEMMRIEVKRRGEGIRHGLWMRTSGIFERPKILTRQTADEIIAAYDKNNYYYSNTLHGTTIRDNSYDPFYVLAILNSSLMTWYYRNTTAEEGKVFAQIKIELLRLLPIKRADNEEQKSFVEAVNKILAITQSNDYLQNPQKQAKVKALEREIDQLVYKLYNLTPEEIKIVEGENENAD